MQPVSISILLLTLSFIGCGGDNHDNTPIPIEQNNQDNNTNPIEPRLKPKRNERAIKPVKEIIRDFEKVNRDPWEALNGEKDSLEGVALDVEISFPQPIGELMSRVILLNRYLLSIVKYGLNIEGWQDILNKISSDLFELKSEINFLLEGTPETDGSKLLYIYDLNKIIDLLINSVEEINENAIIFTEKPYCIIEDKGFLLKRKAELTMKNRELAAVNLSLRNDNLALKCKQIELKEEIRSKEELLRASRLLGELIKQFS
ncbi:hypothetical protein [Mycoavidus sp. B2-EB]|uniref:hypothetical protein n=1 Tax=Mycoavidus sp. B2-EB TaxID=2651972 RepID=UPI001623C943|nr:hypothetical protein [Mycoavidus sp. B2-EB]BBO60110.1 hypothetical protein MPB2EB_1249 [Mycoavidus sp. B2-EB]